MPPAHAPVTLAGDVIRLEPLDAAHFGPLADASLDGDLFRWFTRRLADRPALEQYLRDALAEQEAGTSIPFATILQGDGRAIGATRFMNISVRDGRYEIGSTWVAKPWQRTAANTEAKYLMLRHAFEVWGARRVELKTHAQNAQSRAAIERLGAKFEGVHRNHMLMPDGSMRDTAWYSIIDSEWPAVKAALSARLASAPDGGAPDAAKRATRAVRRP